MSTSTANSRRASEDATSNAGSDEPIVVDDPQKPEIEASEIGTTCEIKALDERQDSHGQPQEIEREDFYTSNNKKPYYAKFALVTKRYFDSNKKLTKTTLVINSPQLREIIKDVVKYYPAQPGSFDEPILMKSPFPLLAHYHEEILGYETEDPVTREHQKLLKDFIDIEMGETLKEAKKVVDAGFITFPLLYTIYRPGDLLYGYQFGHSFLARLEKTVYGEDKFKQPNFKIYYTYTAYDGKRIGRASEIYTVDEKMHIPAPMPIKNLGLFPARFADVDLEALQERLAERGERYLKIQGVQTVRYDGPFQYLKTPPEDYYSECDDMGGIWLPHATTGRIVVDNKTFGEDHKKVALNVRGALTECEKAFLAPQPRHVILDEPDIDPKLCPPYTFGYCLTLRKWGRFYIDQIEDAGWKPNPFDELVLDDTHKRIIKSLVNSHQFPDKARDEAEAKGKGLVMLLHGSPGVGKTLTAETVAEHSKRAILKVSTGELGQYVYTFTRKVRKILRLATIWKAVVLIDEADVFLEVRSTDQLEHNGLVAAFLHELEYFHGIMFLTSNRVSVFDPAIRSRIHLALQYLPPTREVRKTLWLNRLRRVPASLLSFENDEQALEVIDELCDHDMNGREIANAINTAKTLAMDEGVKLKGEHLKIMVAAWKTFEEALGRAKVEGDVGFDKKA